MRVKEQKLEDVFWFQEGPGVRKWQFTDSGIKLLNVANILKSGQLNLAKTERHLSVDEVNTRYKHFLADEGDLVIASSGITVDTDGFLRTRGAFVFKHHLPLCMNTSTIRFKAVQGVSDLVYLKHWLDSYEFRIQITHEVTGIAQKNFGPSHLKRLNISLPPLPEQKRIAQILDAADALRAKRRESIAQLDALVQSTFLEMFGDPKINPMSWPVEPLSHVVAQLKGGKNIAESETTTDFKVLKVSAVTSGIFRPNESKYLPADFSVPDSYIVKAGDLLISRANTTELVGATAYVWETPENIALPDKLWRVEMKNNSQIEPLFLFVLSRGRHFRSMLSERASGTSGSMRNISKPKLLSTPIILPPVALQIRFTSVVRSIQTQKSLLQTHLSELNTLFASLQSRAFNGEL